LIKKLLLLLVFLPSFVLSNEKPHAVLDKHPGSGFFSCFQIAIGLLDDYEQGTYSGVSISFKEDTLYYDKRYGKNWWNYYFEPISFGPSTAPRLSLYSTRKLGTYAYQAGFALSRDRCKKLIDKYIKIKPEITHSLNTFLLDHFHNKPFIGVQYRGTDKFIAESFPLSPQKACQMIKQLIEEKGLEEYKIFVATDTEQFLQLMKKTFHKKIVSFNAMRSSNGKAVHFQRNLSGYKKGLDALLDCLALSRSSFLIRTSSNLSNTALIFNPSLRSHLLNRGTNPTRDRQDEGAHPQ